MNNDCEYNSIITLWYNNFHKLSLNENFKMSVYCCLIKMHVLKIGCHHLLFSLTIAQKIGLVQFWLWHNLLHGNIAKILSGLSLSFYRLCLIKSVSNSRIFGERYYYWFCTLKVLKLSHYKPSSLVIALISLISYAVYLVHWCDINAYECFNCFLSSMFKFDSITRNLKFYRKF